LIIGTPTRINDLATHGDLHVHLASYVVVDEADLMIDLGLIEEVDHIATRLDEQSHIAVFSATIPKSLHPFLNKYLENSEYVQIEKVNKNNKNIQLLLIITTGEAKMEKTLNLMDFLNVYLCIICFNSRDHAHERADQVNAAGLQLRMILRRLPPRERQQQMK